MIGCSKYVGNNTSNNSTNSSGNTGTGPTPIDQGTGQSGGSSTVNDSADAVYIQGVFAENFEKTFFARNNATGSLAQIASKGYYTKLSQSSYKFHYPHSTNDKQVGTALGSVNFPNKGFYTVLLNNTSPSVVVLDNGQNSKPSSSKAYVRFINITTFNGGQQASLHLNRNSQTLYYFSNRKPYDIYANYTNDSTTWISIYNQQYNIVNSDYTEVNPGYYDADIYLTNNLVWDKQPSFDFVGGKKYTIFVRQKDSGTPTIYYFGILTHN
jgi:hypothetical protein